MGLRRRFVALTGLAATAVLVPHGGAEGEVRRSLDRTRDVVAVRIDAGPNLEHVATRLPERRHGDIVVMRAAHARREVVVALRFRRLRVDERMSHEVVVRTPAARYSFSFGNTGRRVFDRFLWNETDNERVTSRASPLAHCPRTTGSASRCRAGASAARAGSA